MSTPSIQKKDSMGHPIKKNIEHSASNKTEKRPYKPLILLPAYNEGLYLDKVIRGIQKEAPGFPILVVDDGSQDTTVKTAKKLGAKVISLPFNCGYGVAIQTGFRYAMNNDYNLVVQMDADGQHDPKSIKFLLKEIINNPIDVVIGSRFLTNESYKPSLPRRLGIKFFALLASIIIRQKITDPTSGYQVLKNDAIRFVASDWYPPDYPDADFIILLHKCGFRIQEVPVKMHSGPKHKSMHNGSKPMYYIFKMFLSIFITLLRQKPKSF